MDIALLPAQSVSALENRDLLRRKDATDRFPGILGIYLERAKELMAIPEVDRRDGAICESEIKEPAIGGRRLPSSYKCLQFTCWEHS